MKKLFIFFLLISSFAFSQKKVFKRGEFLKFKISYGLLNAGFASLEIKPAAINNQNLYHVDGKGWTEGMVDYLFPVKDSYQTYFDPKTQQPVHFIRKIEEGGYIKDKEIFFDFQKLEAKVVNHKHNSEKVFTLKKDVQDMVSALYYLRNMDLSNLKEEEIVTINLFFDEETTAFQLRLKKREIISTKFGKVKTLVFKPTVQLGRVFKEEENVTLWITDDENKIPIKIKAGIVIGSLKAELISYKGLSNMFPIIFN